MAKQTLTETAKLVRALIQGEDLARAHGIHKDEYWHYLANFWRKNPAALERSEFRYEDIPLITECLLASHR